MKNKQHQIDEKQPHIQSVMGRYGRTYYFRHDEYVGKSVFQYGEFSPEECDFILDLANEKKGLVLDIGANIGCITQALLANNHRVFSFEPQPELFKLLQRNTRQLHRSGGVVLFDCALGSKEGTAQMPKVDYSKKGNFGGLAIGSGVGLTVPVDTVDHIQPQDVSLMKIDVEGYEEEVLRGAVETINKYKPILYLEADREEKLYSLHRFITEELGYTVEKHSPPLFSPNNYFENPVRIWDKNYVSVNWVCRPK